MVVPTTVWCTSKERVQCKKDLRVSLTTVAAPSCIIDIKQCGGCIFEFLCFAAWVSQTDLRPPAYLHTFVSLMTFTLYCLRRLPCPSDGFALTSPAEASVFWRKSAGVRMCRCVRWAGVPQGSVSGPAPFSPRTYSLCDWQPDINRDISRYLLYPSKVIWRCFSFHHFQVHS